MRWAGRRPLTTSRTEWNPASEVSSARYMGITLLRSSLALGLTCDGEAILPFWYSPEQNIRVGLGCFIIVET